MKPIISIIVPIYRVEQYLSKCIDSLLNQTFKDIEIILVDDGSPDSSPAICDTYKTRDERINVIHKKNGGLSSARNAGLSISHGKYIGFVDSDDWVEPNMYEEMYNFLVANDCDLVECGINLIYENKISKYSTKANELVSGREALHRHLNIYTRTNQTLPRTAVWSKLFKREFWDSNRFPEGEIHEDYLLTCKALFEAKRVGLIHKGLLNHLTCNPTSIVNSKFTPRDLYKERQLHYRIDYLKSKGDESLQELAILDYYNYIPSAIWRCDTNCLFDERDELYNKIYKEKRLIFSLDLPHKRKFEIFLMLHFKKLYFLIRRILNR